MAGKLPKTLYVRWNGEGEDEWLMAGKDMEDMLEAPPDKQRVGIYQLTKVVTAETSVSTAVIDN